MMFSGFQHLLGSPDLREHYKAVAIPGVTSLSIGLLQIFVGIALFLPKTRRSACAGLCIVMALILIEHAVRCRGGDGAVQAFIIGVTALIGAMRSSERVFSKPLLSAR